MQLGPAHRAEAEAMAALASAVLLEAPAPAFFLRVLCDAQGRSWCARDEQGQVLGYALGQRVADEWHLYSLAVREVARGQGLAMRLLEQALQAARAEGLRAAHLECRASNAAAVALYERAGFRAVGHRQRYYPNGEDAVLMSCELKPVLQNQDGEVPSAERL